MKMHRAVRQLHSLLLLTTHLGVWDFLVEVIKIRLTIGPLTIGPEQETERKKSFTFK